MRDGPMLFVTHLAAAVLLGRISRLPMLPLVVGAAFPDLLDKPLGTLGISELYHSIGHSVFFALLLIPLALYGRVWLAFAVGWASHLLLDTVHVVVNGRPGHALAFLWPLAESTDPLGIPPGEFFRYYLGTPSFYLEIVLWAALLGVLVIQRRSGADARRTEFGDT